MARGAPRQARERSTRRLDDAYAFDAPHVFFAGEKVHGLHASARPSTAVRAVRVAARGALLATFACEGGTYMTTGKIDQAKGRVKEAAGALSGNRKLKREGKIDQAAGKAKDAITSAADKVKRAVNRHSTP